jgi:hypothetical protein
MDLNHEYRELPLAIPTLDEKNRISLGEGNTPLIKSREIGRQLGLKNLYFKLETVRALPVHTKIALRLLPFRTCLWKARNFVLRLPAETQVPLFQHIVLQQKYVV